MCVCVCVCVCVRGRERNVYKRERKKRYHKLLCHHTGHQYQPGGRDKSGCLHKFTVLVRAA